MFFFLSSFKSEVKKHSPPLMSHMSEWVSETDEITKNKLK